MLSFDANRRSLLSLLALAGCGFTPLLGSDQAAHGLMGTVRAADPVDQAGFDFAKRIAERFGPASVPMYDLGFTPATVATGVGVTAQGAITRYNLTGSVVWTLTRHTDGVRMTGGTVDSFTSYSATGSTVAGLAAKEDAARRLMVILADQVVADIMITAGRWPK